MKEYLPTYIILNNEMFDYTRDKVEYRLYNLHTSCMHRLFKYLWSCSQVQDVKLYKIDWSCLRLYIEQTTEWLVKSP